MDSIDKRQLMATQQSVAEKVRIPSITAFDVGMCAALVLFGVFFFASCLRVTDYVYDSTYPDLASSLLIHHSYQSFFQPETMVPPGFPFILAVVAIFTGFSPTTFIHAVAVSSTLGLLASYWLLRQTGGWALAAIACLLLASSPWFLMSSTQLVFSDMPYFGLSIASLLLALKLDHSKSAKACVSWMLLLGLTLALTILVRTVGVTLLMSIAVWVPASLLSKKEVAKRRGMRFLLPFVLGAFAMLAWTNWANHRRFSEWQLPGYPQSYLSQLVIKNGNNPGMGYAHLADLPARIRDNVLGWSTAFSVVLTHKEANPSFWPSPAVVGVIALILIGLSASLLKGGGQLHDWYFLFYAATYSVWPWNLEIRFLIPIVPLGCLYLWRGGLVLKDFAKARRERAGMLFLLVGAILSIISVRHGAHVKSVYRDLAVGCWILVALLGCVLLLDFNFEVALARRHLRTICISTGISAIAFLVGLGVFQQIPVARGNRNFDVTKSPFYGDIEAGEWIRAHEPSTSIVMARKRDLVFHYSGDRLVWFPPISDPATLMQGIRRYHVQFVVIAFPSWDYWAPTDQDAMNRLLAAYGSEFHLVHQVPSDQIYAVDSEVWNSGTGSR